MDFSATEDLRGHGGILKIGFDDAAREQGDFVFCKRVSQIKAPDPFSSLSNVVNLIHERVPKN
jgi:hypothetical protein